MEFAETNLEDNFSIQIEFEDQETLSEDYSIVGIDISGSSSDIHILPTNSNGGFEIITNQGNTSVQLNHETGEYDIDGAPLETITIAPILLLSLWQALHFYSRPKDRWNCEVLATTL